MSQKAGARLAPYASFHKHGASGTIKQCNIFLAVVFVVVRLVVLLNQSSEKEYFAVVRGRDKGIFQSWADVEDKIYGLSDILYFQCSTMKTAEEKLGIWSRRKRKKIWRRLYDND